MVAYWYRFRVVAANPALSRTSRLLTRLLRRELRLCWELFCIMYEGHESDDGDPGSPGHGSRGMTAPKVESERRISRPNDG